jgi:uncharacterized protein YndB with AHSA1/START domain
MTATDFTYTVITDRPPEEVFQAIGKVRDWWSGYYSEAIEGDTEKLNDEFSFRAGGGLHYSKQKLIEVVPNKKVVWLITDSEFSFIEKKDEWTGTQVIFEISAEKNKTKLVFTHKGLVPEIECYKNCTPAWSQYLENKLLPLINKGKSAVNH